MDLNSFIWNVLSTLAGVFIAFKLEARTDQKSKEQVFTVLMHQISFEWAINSEFAKESVSIFKQHEVTLRRFKIDAIQRALGSTEFYEFATASFINKLQEYEETLLMGNRTLDLMQENFQQKDWTINEKYEADLLFATEKLKAIVTKTEEITHIHFKKQGK